MSGLMRPVRREYPWSRFLKDAPDTSRISFVGVNDYQLGRQYGEQILKLVPPDKDDVEVMLLLHDRDNSSQVQIAEQINNLLVTSPDTSGRVRLIQETMRSTGKVDADETIRNIFFPQGGSTGCPCVYRGRGYRGCLPGHD